MDKIKSYRLRRNRRLEKRGIRMDADEEGRWVTTDNGHKVHFNEGGEPDKGNPHVISKMNGGSGASSEKPKGEDGVRESYRRFLRELRRSGADSDESQEALGNMIDAHLGDEVLYEKFKEIIDDHIASEVDFSEIDEDDLDSVAYEEGERLRKEWHDEVKDGIARTLGLSKLPDHVSKAVDDFLEWNDDYDISPDDVVDAYNDEYDEWKAHEHEKEPAFRRRWWQ